MIDDNTYGDLPIGRRCRGKTTRRCVKGMSRAHSPCRRVMDSLLVLPGMAAYMRAYTKTDEDISADQFAADMT